MLSLQDSRIVHFFKYLGDRIPYPTRQEWTDYHDFMVDKLVPDLYSVYDRYFLEPLRYIDSYELGHWVLYYPGMEGNEKRVFLIGLAVGVPLSWFIEYVFWPWWTWVQVEMDKSFYYGTGEVGEAIAHIVGWIWFTIPYFWYLEDDVVIEADYAGLYFGTPDMKELFPNPWFPLFWIWSFLWVLPLFTFNSAKAPVHSMDEWQVASTNAKHVPERHSGTEVETREFMVLSGEVTRMTQIWPQWRVFYTPGVRARKRLRGLELYYNRCVLILATIRPRLSGSFIWNLILWVALPILSLLWYGTVWVHEGWMESFYYYCCHWEDPVYGWIPHAHPWYVFDHLYLLERIHGYQDLVESGEMISEGIPIDVLFARYTATDAEQIVGSAAFTDYRVFKHGHMGLTSEMDNPYWTADSEDFFDNDWCWEPYC